MLSAAVTGAGCPSFAVLFNFDLFAASAMDRLSFLHHPSNVNCTNDQKPFQRLA